MATATRKQIPALIAMRQDFKGSSITGKTLMYPMSDTGRMPWAEAEIMLDSNPTYVVYSYGTPIAYITQAGERIVPDVKYSQTTSCHQGLARRGFAL